MKILVISLTYNNNSPQSIRIKNLVNEWIKYHNVTVLLLGEKDSITNNDNLIIHELKCSSLTSKMVRLNSNKNLNKNTRKPSIKNKILRFLKKLILLFSFPDFFVIEQRKIKNKLNSLSKNQYEKVIVSASPFSLMSLSKFIAVNYVDSNFIYDVGDPFFSNFQNSSIRNFMAKKYEKKYLPFIDKIVVPSNEMKNSYINFFNVMPEKLKVIQQGIPNIFINKKLEPKKQINHAKVNLIYAGIFYKNLREPFELFKTINNLNGTANLDIYGVNNIYFIVKSNFINYFPNITQEILFEKYRLADIIVFIDNKEGIHIPGKFYELLSLNRPILFIYYNEKMSTYQIAKNYNHVITVQNNEKEIEMGIETIISNYNRLTNNSNFENLSWSQLAINYFR